MDGYFDIQVVDSPHELYKKVVKEKGGRLLAGYAWELKTKIVNGELPKDVIIEAHDFAIHWNDLTGIDWAIHQEGADQIGCIRTVQGIEMEYVGIIIRNDLTYNLETQSIEVKRENFKDKDARPAKSKGKNEINTLDQLVRNTYKH